MSQERPIRLHAGPWSVEFERWSGWIRCIRLGGVEVVRSIYAVARGDDWATYTQRVVTSHVSQEEGSFLATWKAELDDLDFSWEGSVSSDGTELQVQIVGFPQQDFQSRRTGLCLLHPREVAGLACEITHSDGRVESGAFPNQIEAEQPFFDIHSISHPVGDARVQMVFGGEVFEMEDQRNYTDVSFKTYCRPQEWPQPFEIHAGERIDHSVILSFDGALLDWVPTNRTLLTRSEEWVSVPRIGTLSSKHLDDFDFTLNPSDPSDWTQAGFGPLHQTGSFIELNRNRINLEDYGGVAFGATPQVHAFDERTIMENSHGLYDVVVNAKEIAGGRAVAVGPLVLKNRRQAWDDRLEREVGAVWLLSSLMSLSDAGASATCVIREEDFNDSLFKVVRLLRQAHRIRPLHSTDSYRVIGFEYGDPLNQVLVNLRPYITCVNLSGIDLELEPYEIRRLGPEGAFQ